MTVIRPRGFCHFAHRQAFTAAQSLARSIECFGKPSGAEWLQEIVDGVDLERSQRVLVVGGHENHGHVAADQIEHLEAVEFRHLHVEKQQIGLQFGHHFDRLESVGALGYDFHVRHRRQILAEHRSRQRFVVDDGHSQGRGRAVVSHRLKTAG